MVLKQEAAAAELACRVGGGQERLRAVGAVGRRVDTEPACYSRREVDSSVTRGQDIRGGRPACFWSGLVEDESRTGGGGTERPEGRIKEEKWPVFSLGWTDSQRIGFSEAVAVGMRARVLVRVQLLLQMTQKLAREVPVTWIWTLDLHSHLRDWLLTRLLKIPLPQVSRSRAQNNTSYIQPLSLRRVLNNGIGSCTLAHRLELKPASRGWQGTMQYLSGYVPTWVPPV